MKALSIEAVKKLGNVFQDHKGNSSSTRIIMFMVVGVWLWHSIYSHIQTGIAPVLDLQDLALFTSMFGTKLGSKYLENKTK